MLHIYWLQFSFEFRGLAACVYVHMSRRMGAEYRLLVCVHVERVIILVCNSHNRSAVRYM